MTDRRPERVYGLLMRDDRVFLRACQGGLSLPGGIFRPMAQDRKVELRAHIYDQFGVEARSVWAQGAFDYLHPDEAKAQFSGFYSVWEWDGDIPPTAGEWLDKDGVMAARGLPASLRILLVSVLDTVAIKTT